MRKSMQVLHFHCSYLPVKTTVIPLIKVTLLKQEVSSFGGRKIMSNTWCHIFRGSYL